MEETVLLCKPAAHWRRSVGLACEDRDAVDEFQRREEAEEVGLEMKRLVLFFLTLPKNLTTRFGP